MAGRGSHQTPIIGFRRDRVGARLIGILNILRFRKLFGDTAARFAWLSEPDGPYPDLADPSEIFAPEFIRDVIDIVDAAPDFSSRVPIANAVQRKRPVDFQQMLNEGSLWSWDAHFWMLRFREERAADVAAEARALTEGLALSPRLEAARDAALAKIRGGADEAVAIHLRRGDILDGDPWSWQAWPSKYAPDEYYHAFLKDVSGPIIAFSDTPAAIGHLQDERVISVDTLIGDDDLTRAQRDVLEILLMAHCRRVAAPTVSAFSQAAAVLGGFNVLALPMGLEADAKAAADAALLDRILSRPDSFLAPGDLAQSLYQVLPSASDSGRETEIIKRFSGDAAFLDRFPFIANGIAQLAAGAGNTAEADRLASSVIDNPKAVTKDKFVAGQVKALLRAGDEESSSSTADWSYVTDLFVGRRADGPVMPELGGVVLTKDGVAGHALGISAELATTLVTWRLTDEASPDYRLAPWIAQQGWIELIQFDRMVSSVRASPSVPDRLAPAAMLLEEIEPSLSDGRLHEGLTGSQRDLLSWAATGLTARHRLAKAMRLLEWLLRHDPGDAMASKRMADACFAAGNERAGWRWLDRALDADGSAPLLHLSAASRLAGMGHRPIAQAQSPEKGSEPAKRQRRHLRKAEELAPDLPLVNRTRRFLNGLGRSGKSD